MKLRQLVLEVLQKQVGYQTFDNGNLKFEIEKIFKSNVSTQVKEFFGGDSVSKLVNKHKRNLVILLLLPKLILNELEKQVKVNKENTVLKNIKEYTPSLIPPGQRDITSAKYLKMQKKDNLKEVAEDIINNQRREFSEESLEGESRSNLNGLQVEQQSQSEYKLEDQQSTAIYNAGWQLATKVAKIFMKNPNSHDDEKYSRNGFLQLCASFFEYQLKALNSVNPQLIVKLYLEFYSSLAEQSPDQNQYLRSLLCILSRYIILNSKDFIDSGELDQLTSDSSQVKIFLFSMLDACASFGQDNFGTYKTFAGILTQLISEQKFQYIVDNLEEFIRTVSLEELSYLLIAIYQNQQLVSLQSSLIEYMTNQKVTDQSKESASILEKVLECIHNDKKFVALFQQDTIENFTKVIWNKLNKANAMDCARNVYYAALNRKLNISLPNIEQAKKIIMSSDGLKITKNVKALLQQYKDLLVQNKSSDAEDFLNTLLGEITSLVDLQILYERAKELQIPIDEIFKVKLKEILSKQSGVQQIKDFIQHNNANNSNEFRQKLAMAFFELDTDTIFLLDDDSIITLMSLYPADKDLVFDNLLSKATNPAKVVNIIKNADGIEFLIKYYCKKIYKQQFSQQCNAILQILDPLKDYLKIEAVICEWQQNKLIEFYRNFYKAKQKQKGTYLSLLGMIVKDDKRLSTAQALIEIICEESFVDEISADTLLRIFEKDVYSEHYVEIILNALQLSYNVKTKILDAFEAKIIAWSKSELFEIEISKLSNKQLFQVKKLKLALYIKACTQGSDFNRLVGLMVQLNDSGVVGMFDIILTNKPYFRQSFNIDCLMALYKSKLKSIVINKLMDQYVIVGSIDDLIKDLSHISKTDELLFEFSNLIIQKILTKKLDDKAYDTLCSQTHLNDVTCKSLLDFANNQIADVKEKLYTLYLENVLMKTPAESKTMLKQISKDNLVMVTKITLSLKQDKIEQLMPLLTEVFEEHYKYVIQILTNKDQKEVILQQIVNSDKGVDCIRYINSFRDLPLVKDFIKASLTISLKAISDQNMDINEKRNYFNILVEIDSLKLADQHYNLVIIYNSILDLLSSNEGNDDYTKKIAKFYIEKTNNPNDNNCKNLLRRYAIKQELKKTHRWIYFTFIKKIIVYCKLWFSSDIIVRYREQICGVQKQVANVIDKNNEKKFSESPIIIEGQKANLMRHSSSKSLLDDCTNLQQEDEKLNKSY